MWSVTVLVSVFIMLVAAPGVALDLPPAPKGFSWIKLPEIKGALLTPTGWHFRMLEVAAMAEKFDVKDDAE